MIDDCKFSPDGRFIAAGCHDSNIYVYEVLPKYVGSPSEERKPVAKTFALSVASDLRQRLLKLQDALNAAISSSDSPEVTRDTCSDKVLRGLLSSLKTTRDTDLYKAVRRLIAQLGEKFYGDYCERRGHPGARWLVVLCMQSPRTMKTPIVWTLALLSLLLL